MKNSLNISFIQSNIIWENIDINLIHHEKLINKIIDKPDLIVLPEMFTTGFTLQALKLAEDMSGKAVNWMIGIAKKQNTTIAGSIIFKEDNKYFNRFLWVSPNGNIEFYDKRHLFRMAGEHKHYTAGGTQKVVILNDFRIRLFVCYDLRFPVWCRNKNDYDLAIFIANWPDRRNEAWKTLLAARAMENQTYVLGVNRCGIDGMNLNYSGDSRLIDSFGNILSSCEAYKEEIITCKISLDDLNKHRQIFPVHMDADDFNILTNII